MALNKERNKIVANQQKLDENINLRLYAQMELT